MEERRRQFHLSYRVNRPPRREKQGEYRNINMQLDAVTNSLYSISHELLKELYTKCESTKCKINTIYRKTISIKCLKCKHKVVLMCIHYNYVIHSFRYNIYINLKVRSTI